MSNLNIVGIQFRKAGKIYDFSYHDMELKVGNHVVVNTEKGVSYGQVVRLQYVEKSSLGKGRKLKSIVRKANSNEIDRKPKMSEEEISNFTKEKAKQLKLDMKVLKCEVQYGGNKIIIFFSAPGRVDFRDLVKELAKGLKTRLELKQIGARDETKILGGIGVCGREYCCSSFLREFVPVSVKMAKNQNLALNPAKISGGCGRLLCCLTYEDDTYSSLRKTMPPIGIKVRLKDHGLCSAKVLKSDLLNQSVLVELEDGEKLKVAVTSIEVKSRPEVNKKKSQDNDPHHLDDNDKSSL